MANTAERKCQVRMQSGICRRPLYDEKCICHSKEKDKDVGDFRRELARVFADESSEYFDLTGFVFLSCADLPRVYSKDVRFLRAQFLQDASFESVRFGGAADFGGAQFSDDAGFAKAQFSGRARFIEAQFKFGVNFSEARFNDEADFWATQFADTVSYAEAKFSQKANFRDAQFEGHVSFRQVRFATNANFSATLFSAKADFQAAQFSGEAEFRKAKFKSEAIFSDAGFSDIASFTEAECEGHINFEAAKFRGESTTFDWARFLLRATFDKVVFAGPVTFLNTKFAGHATFDQASFENDTSFQFCQISRDALVRFDASLRGKQMFEVKADFTQMELSRVSRLVFRKVDLTNCWFLETDVTQVEYIDVDWPLTGRWWDKWWKRKCVADESILESKLDVIPDYSLIAQLYRRLQKNYIESYQYAEAGDFYDGEQEMVRRSKGKLGQYFCTNFLYRLVSDYGETWWKPLILLGPTLLIFPFVLLFSGINLAKYYGYGNANHITDYAWSFDPGDFLFFTKDYWDAFFANLSFVTFARADIAKALAEPYQRGLMNLESVLAVTFATFFLLALRRKYKRKSF